MFEMLVQFTERLPFCCCLSLSLTGYSMVNALCWSNITDLARRQLWCDMHGNWWIWFSMQSTEIMPRPDMLFSIIALSLLDWWIACAMRFWWFLLLIQFTRVDTPFDGCCGGIARYSLAWCGRMSQIICFCNGKEMLSSLWICNALASQFGYW